MRAFRPFAFWKSSAAAPAPTLASVLSTLGSWAVGDIDGGYQVTLTGTNFTGADTGGANGVKFGAASATAVVVVNPTTITCTVPAHATGSVSVVVTTPGGSNGANSLFRYFSPAQLTLTGWWRSFANPTTPTASAGGSGGNGNLAPGVAPTFGTLNGHADAIFNGTTQWLAAANAPTTYWSAAAGTIVSLAKAPSPPVATANTFTDPAIASENGGDIMATVTSTNGFSMTINDGAYKTASRAFTAANWNAFQGTWDSTNVKARVNGGTAVATLAGANAGMGTTLEVGTNFNQSVFTALTIAELITATSAFTTAQLDDIRAYFTTRYQQSV